MMECPSLPSIEELHLYITQMDIALAAHLFPNLREINLWFEPILTREGRNQANDPVQIDTDDFSALTNLRKIAYNSCGSGIDLVQFDLSGDFKVPVDLQEIVIQFVDLTASLDLDRKLVNKSDLIAQVNELLDEFVPIEELSALIFRRRLMTR